MKLKVSYSERKGVKRCVAMGDKGDELAYADAELVREGSLASLVPLVYDTAWGKCRFTYAAQGFVPLTELVKKPLRVHQLETMLLSLLSLLEDCEKSGLSRQRVSMELAHVLLNPANDRLRFLYVPLESFVSASTSFKSVLVYVLEHARVSAEEMELRDRALDVARRMTVVTSVDFRERLVELGVIEREAEGLRPADEGVWSNTDQLGSRAGHGFDFAARQRAVNGGREEQAAKGEDSEPVRRAAPAVREAGRSVPAASHLRPSSSTDDSDPGTTVLGGWQLMRSSTGQTWQLPDGEFYLGRRRDNSIFLPDVCGLSRHHALLTVHGAECFIEDLRTTNGTRVNGQKITPKQDFPLSQGDVVHLADEEFLVL